MNAILMSIQPKWCELIANGIKTIEVRKTAPKETPFRVYMYCTKGKSYLYRNPNNGELFLDSNGGYRGGDYEDRYLTGKVIGEFICDKVDLVEYKGGDYMINDDIAYTNTIASGSCLDYDEMYKRLKNQNGYALNISNPKIYDKPKEIYTFHRVCEKKCNSSCDWYIPNDYIKCGCGGKPNVVRAPQSWQYVEEIGE